MDNGKSVSKYDDTRGSLEMQRGAGEVLFTKPTTIKTVERVKGTAETFIIETARHAEDGDTVFIECIDESNVVTRLALPPRVANAIARQRDALTTRTRSRVAKASAQARKERGELPGFLRHRGKA
jgi:hypothetical protein